MQLPLRMGEILAQAGVMIYDAKGIPVGRLYDAKEAAVIVAAVNERAAMQAEIERLREAIADLRRFFDDPVVVEHVAAWSHQSWSGWYKWMAAKWDQVHLSTGETFQERWKRQSETQYVLLSDSEQNSDRAEAKEILSELYKSLPWPRFKEEDGEDQSSALDALEGFCP